MAKNELLPFADGEDANVLPTNQWEALTDILENGFQSGIARSEQVNRVLAQGAVASYVLGQLIVDQLNKNATLDKDTLYQNLVSALQENAKDACLPLSGGTMTGAIKTGGDAIVGKTNDSWISIFSGTSINGGASLELNGHSRGDVGARGNFVLRASDANGNIYELHGRTDGGLTWNGCDIEQPNHVGTHFIRYSSGLQICWGTARTESNRIATITFEMPFIYNPYISALVSGDNAIVYSPMLRTCTPTGITLLANNSEGNQAGVAMDWIAIGRWK